MADCDASTVYWPGNSASVWAPTSPGAKMGSALWASSGLLEPVISAILPGAITSIPIMPASASIVPTPTGIPAGSPSSSATAADSPPSFSPSALTWLGIFAIRPSAPTWS